MKIKVLMENTPSMTKYQAEHGLSLYIDTGDRKILFDSGASGAFLSNARLLGVDLGSVDFAVLSHGHDDHSGGMNTFLRENDHAPIYMNKKAVGDHNSSVHGYIGLDEELKHSDRIIFTEDKLNLGGGMTLYSANELTPIHPINPVGMSVRENGIETPETFRHEQYLVVEEKGRRILFSGCSHKGVLNIMHWFKPDIFVGGFHFMTLEPTGKGAKKLEDGAKELLSYDTMYYTGHCTGVPQYEFMKKIMGDRLEYIASGSSFEI